MTMYVKISKLLDDNRPELSQDKRMPLSTQNLNGICNDFFCFNIWANVARKDVLYNSLT